MSDKTAAEVAREIVAECGPVVSPCWLTQRIQGVLEPLYDQLAWMSAEKHSAQASEERIRNENYLLIAERDQARADTKRLGIELRIRSAKVYRFDIPAPHNRRGSGAAYGSGYESGYRGLPCTTVYDRNPQLYAWLAGYERGERESCEAIDAAMKEQSQ